MTLVVTLGDTDAAPTPVPAKKLEAATAPVQTVSTAPTAAKPLVGRTAGATAAATGTAVVFKRGNKRVAGMTRPNPAGKIGNMDAINEKCYKICDTCTCGAGEQLNCCSAELPDEFAGCQPGNALALCGTNRPVNSCCI
ncbi:hypothetical protein OEZ86_005579 [Tetradesmus obliquus]|nr:hypothetical protein OEZ86_005579 [Tetradesmus obliquus]